MGGPRSRRPGNESPCRTPARARGRKRWTKRKVAIEVVWRSVWIFGIFLGLWLALFARRRTRPGRRASGGTPSIASRARASVGSTRGPSGRARRRFRRFASGSTRGLGEETARREGERVPGAIRNRDVACARMSTSLPLPSSPHWGRARRTPGRACSTRPCWRIRRRGRSATASTPTRCGARLDRGDRRWASFPRTRRRARGAGRDGGHDAHRSNGRMSWVVAEPRRRGTPSVRLTADVAGPRGSRVLYPAAVCCDKPRSAGAGEKICLRTAARSRS